jgi:hypothetical protein
MYSTPKQKQLEAHQKKQADDREKAAAAVEVDWDRTLEERQARAGDRGCSSRSQLDGLVSTRCFKGTGRTRLEHQKS